MTKKVQAIFDGKVLCPEEPVDLEINGRHILNIEPVVDNDGKEDKETEAAFDISSLSVKTGIPDLALGKDLVERGLTDQTDLNGLVVSGKIRFNPFNLRLRQAGVRSAFYNLFKIHSH